MSPGTMEGTHRLCEAAAAALASAAVGKGFGRFGVPAWCPGHCSAHAQSKPGQGPYKSSYRCLSAAAVPPQQDRLTRARSPGRAVPRGQLLTALRAGEQRWRRCRCHWTFAGYKGSWNLHSCPTLSCWPWPAQCLGDMCPFQLFIAPQTCNNNCFGCFLSNYFYC